MKVQETSMTRCRPPMLAQRPGPWLPGAAGTGSWWSRVLCAWGAVVSLTGWLATGCLGDLPEVACLSAEDCPAGAWCAEGRCEPGGRLAACVAPADAPQRVVGSECGACDAGVWACAGGEWRCDGDVRNACGGCLAAPGALGEICGPCGAVWACGDDGEYRCDGVLPDACMGCGGSSAAPGDRCTIEGGAVGVQVCGEFGAAAECLTQDPPRCTFETTDVPACDACGRVAPVCRAGGWECCDAPDCQAPSAARTDPCGTCGWVPERVGQPCFDCGPGVWELSCPSGGLRCSAERNACGGCTPLASVPGSPCEGGIWVCADADTLACAWAQGRNACGGASELEGRPGEACGPCDDGTWVCVGPEQVACRSATPTNACGGCGGLPGVPGEACSAQRVWTCVQTATGRGMACELPAEGSSPPG